MMSANGDRFCRRCGVAGARPFRVTTNRRLCSVEYTLCELCENDVWNSVLLAVMRTAEPPFERKRVDST